MMQRRNSKEPTDKGGWSCYTTSWTGLSINTPATHLPLRANGAAAAPGGGRPTPRWRSCATPGSTRRTWRQQKAIAENIQRRALEVGAFAPLGLQFGPTAFRTNLTGFAKSGFAVFWGVKKTA